MHSNRSSARWELLLRWVQGGGGCVDAVGDFWCGAPGPLGTVDDELAFFRSPCTTCGLELPEKLSVERS